MSGNLEEDEDEISRRRGVRADIKAVNEIIQADRQELRSLNSDKFMRDLHKLGRVTDKADKTRELQLDAIGLKELSLAAKAQAAQINEMSTRYDFEALYLQIRKEFTLDQLDDGVDWQKLGNCANQLMVQIPCPFSILYGPVAQEIKAKKPREMKNKNKDALDDDEEEGEMAGKYNKPIEVVQTENQQDDSAALKRAKLQATKLQELWTSTTASSSSSSSKRKEGAAVDAIDFLVDPSDAVQCIENFFDYSFLLKEHGIQEDLNPKTLLPEIRSAPVGMQGEDEALPPKRQMVLAIHMPDLQRLMDAVKVVQQKEGQGAEGLQGQLHPLHRMDELYTAPTVQEQIELIQNKRKHSSHRSSRGEASQREEEASPLSSKRQRAGTGGRSSSG